MNFLTTKHTNYQSFDSIESVDESSSSSSGQIGSLNGQSGTVYHVSSSTQSPSSQTTPDSIIPLPTSLIPIVAGYCCCSQLNSILPQEARDVFYRDFKHYLCNDPKISSVINEIGCFSISNGDEKFCLETIDNVRQFASKTKIFKAPFFESMKKTGQTLRLVSYKVLTDLDITPIIDKIQRVIDTDCWQLWYLLCFSGYLNINGYIGYNEDATNIVEIVNKNASFFNKFQMGLRENFEELDKTMIPDVKPVREWFNRPENEKILSSLIHVNLCVLENVDVSGIFYFRTFPKEILKMKNLTHLAFGVNYIQYIPKEIEQLKSLTDLHLRASLLPSPLPPFLKKLKEKYNIYYQ